MKSYQIRSLILAGCLVIGISGCSKKQDDTQKTTEQTSTPSQQTPQNMAAANASSKTSGIVIPAKTLAGFLPSVSGYTAKGEPEIMEMDFQGTKYSHARQSYVNGEKHITLALIDFNNISSLTSTYLSLMNMDIETNNGSHHPLKINGNPGWSNWNKSSNSGVIGALIGGRVFATLEGSGGVTIDELKTAASNINASGVESLIK